MTAEERAAYVRGVLTVCRELNLAEHLIVELCQSLKIDAEELFALRDALVVP